MKCRFLGIILLFVLINTLVLAQTPTDAITTTEECKSLYWFDDGTRECGYKSFCGAYMYEGLQTFESIEECENALEQTINPEPTPSPEPEKECIGEGKTGIDLIGYKQDECCQGLEKIENEYPFNETCIQPTDGSFMCAKCGNGECGPGENWCNCPQDCGVPEREKCCPPKCMFVGTRSEGWYDSCTGERIKWAGCAGCKAVCLAKGSRSEGWWSVCKTGAEERIKWGCSGCEENYTVEAIETSGETEEEGTEISVSNVSVSTGEEETVYSVGACPSTIPEVCPEEKEPVCATISHFDFDGGYKKYRKTFRNWCEACKSSTRTDIVVNYVKGECEQDTSVECPLIGRPEPGLCSNGKIEPVYKEINGKKCLVSYKCVREKPKPIEELPVFIYTESNASARTTKVFKLYKSGAMSETKTFLGNNESTKLKGEISHEEMLEFLKKLEELGFFEIEYLKDCRSSIKAQETTETGISSNIAISCPVGAANHTIYARFNKENKLHWYNGLLSEPEAISYALKKVKEFEELMKENPSNTEKFVKLGEPFDLLLGEKAIVRQTGLRVKLEKIENNTAVLLVRVAPYIIVGEREVRAGEATTNIAQGSMGISAKWIEIKIGESKIVFDHKITLNSTLFPKCVSEETETGETLTKCIGAKPFANLTIDKYTDPSNEITAYLNKKFEMKVNDRAKILNEMKNPVMYLTLTALNLPVDCGTVECTVDQETGVEVCPKIWCDLRPVAKLLVRLPSKGGIEIMMIRPIAIREGETKRVAGFTIHFADVIGEKSVFVVKEIEDVPYKKVGLGKEFPLKTRETALIVEKDIFVSLVGLNEYAPQPEPLKETVQKIGRQYAIVSVWKRGKIPAPLSEKQKEKIEKIKERIKEASPRARQEIEKIRSAKTTTEMVMPYRKTYRLVPGQTLKVYDIKLTLNSIRKRSAFFIANEIGYGDTINVDVGEPFKLKENMSARVLGANMRIDLLNIIQEGGCVVPLVENQGEPSVCRTIPKVKIGVSNYLFDVKKIGKPISTSEIEKRARETLISSETETAQAITGIELPPTPFRVFTLGEGETASIGKFEIWVEEIWPEYAVFIVKEKSTGIKFKLVISKGWNLFSLPGEMRSIGSNDCQSSDFRLFEYLPGENRFEKVKKPEAGRAYWLYNPNQACKVEAELVKPVSLFETDSLNKGWNFVPVVKDMFDKKIGEMGNCKLKGAFFYDAENHQWKKALEETLGAEHLGRALAVFAVEKCSLVSPETPIPELPELPELPEVE